MTDRVQVPRELMLFFNESKDREIQRFFSGVESRVNKTAISAGLDPNLLVYTNSDSELASVSDLTAWIDGTADRIDVTDDGDGSVSIDISSNFKIEDIPTDFTDGSIYFAESGFTEEDNDNLHWDSVNKWFSVNVPSADRCCDLNLRGTAHFQTGSLLDTDGVIIRPSPASSPTIGAPIPQITGEILGGVTRAFGLTPGIFLMQDPADFLFSEPNLSFSDSIATDTTVAEIRYDPATLRMEIRGATVVHFSESLRAPTEVAIGNWGTPSTVPTPTSWLHIRDVATGTDHLLHLESGTSGDVAQLFSRGSDQYIMGIDDSDDQRFKISYDDELGVNDRLSIDDTGIVTFYENITIGSDTTFKSFYTDEGDIYSELGKLFIGAGMNARSETFGVGLQLRESTPAKNLVYNIGATFTAATRTISKTGETFITDGVVEGDFVVLTGSTPDRTGGTGEVLAVTQTTITFSIAALGGATPDDLTDVDFIVFNHPIVAFLDNGDLHMNVGESEDARLHIESMYGNNVHSIDIAIFAGVDGHEGINMNVDADTKSGVCAFGINFDATAFSDSDTLGCGVNIVADNTGATNGDFHGIEMSLADPTNTSVEAEAVATGEGVAPIAQYLADSATLAKGYVYDDSATTYTDRTTEFGSAVSNIQIFIGDDDQILLASLAKWDLINVLLTVNSSQSITPVFEYIEDDGDWIVFSANDNTNGFKQSGSIVWNKDDLTTWGQRTVNEVTGDVGAVDYYWIRITRTKDIIAPNVPTETTIQIQTLGDKFEWDKDGNTFTNTMAIVDGVSTPTTVSGKSTIYVDSADGDLKIKFGDGTIKTIVTDT
jgi:hypothetical protein